VPRTLLANACPTLTFVGKIERGFLGLTRRMTVSAHCSKSDAVVLEPAIGCGHCHETLPELKFDLDD
jgi:hypothetical protein